MRPAGEQLAAAMASIELRTPQITVVHNVNAKTESDPQRIRQLLVEQIYSPVQWVDCVRTLLGQGVQCTVECGPGKVLSGLVRRIEKSLVVAILEEPESLDKALVLASELSEEQDGQ
jgi:[acyl-carrier-protein] S-malonyltransferase